MDATTREIYTILLGKKSKRPTSEIKWTETELLQIGDNDWPHIYHSAFKLTTDTKVQTFQFKITHRILACKSNLVLCEETLEFWNQIRRWWKSVSGTNFTVGIYDLIFGLPNDGKDKIINQFNFLLLLSRYYIYRNKQAETAKLHVYELLIEGKTTLERIQFTALEQNREKKFMGNWSELAFGIQTNMWNNLASLPKASPKQSIIWTKSSVDIIKHPTNNYNQHGTLYLPAWYVRPTKGTIQPPVALMSSKDIMAPIYKIQWAVQCRGTQGHYAFVHWAS